MKATVCAFTGHRPKSFPWGYDENTPGCVLLKEVMAAQISALAEQGVTDWLSGMAQGATIQALFVLVHFRITPILFYISGANMRTKQNFIF